MTLDLRQLAVFLAVVQHRSIGRAAEHLGQTQPGVGRTIKRMESEVGVALFDRHPLGMALTDFGRAIVPYAETLLAEHRNALEEVAALRGLAKGVARVGAVASAMSALLPDAISRLLQHAPGLRVQVLEGVEDRLADALVNHEIDLAVAGALPRMEDLDTLSHPPWHDTATIIAAMDHPLRGKPGLELADTVSQRWVLTPPGTRPREEMKQLFASQSLPQPEVAVETRSTSMIRALVARQGFLSWMPQPLYDADRQAGLITPLLEKAAVRIRTLMIFRRRAGLLPPAAVRLLEELRRLR